MADDAAPATGMPPGFVEGVRRFNRGDFFAAHEAFEELLDDAEADARWDLLVALVQVAVGYHKAAARHPGAERMLGLGLEKLRAFPDVAWGVAVEALRRRVADDLAHVAAGGALDGRLAASPPRIALRGTG
jgi:predicted metal-dependent hydrolase